MKKLKITGLLRCTGGDKNVFWTTNRHAYLRYSLFLGTLLVFVWTVGPSAEARTGPKTETTTTKKHKHVIQEYVCVCVREREGESEMAGEKKGRTGGRVDIDGEYQG